MSRPNNAGQGINNLRLTVTSCGGEVLILTGNAAVVLRKDRLPRFENLPSSLRGTGVFFTLPTRF